MPAWRPGTAIRVYEEMSPEDRIRRRVLRAIALNRTPGLHFPGNFIDLSFDRVASGDTRVSYETGPHCVDAHGENDIGSLAVLADFALGTAVRADLDPATRLATVSMTLELGAAPRAGIVGRHRAAMASSARAMAAPAAAAWCSRTPAARSATAAASSWC